MCLEITTKSCSNVQVNFVIVFKVYVLPLYFLTLETNVLKDFVTFFASISVIAQTQLNIYFCYLFKGCKIDVASEAVVINVSKTASLSNEWVGALKGMAKGK